VFAVKVRAWRRISLRGGTHVRAERQAGR